MPPLKCEEIKTVTLPSDSSMGFVISRYAATAAIIGLAAYFTYKALTK
jgi:hypothetical protein